MLHIVRMNTSNVYQLFGGDEGLKEASSLGKLHPDNTRLVYRLISTWVVQSADEANMKLI